MFNEFENDPDDDGTIFIGEDMLNALVELAVGNSNDSGASAIIGKEAPETIVLTPETKQSIMEVLEGSRFYTDYIFYDISDSDGTGYDTEGFVAPGFTFVLKRIDEVINGRAALDNDTFTAGDMGIYADTIEDKVATGGDIASGDFTVYSSVGTSRHIPPSFKIERTRSPGFVDLGDPESWGTPPDGYTVISKINYSTDEEQAFFLKYAAVPGITESTFDDPVTGYLNDIFNTMALDVYNTVLTREYVPKVIKQERTSISAILSVSIGDESDPLESTIYESTTTFEEEA